MTRADAHSRRRGSDPASGYAFRRSPPVPTHFYFPTRAPAPLSAWRMTLAPGGDSWNWLPHCFCFGTATPAEYLTKAFSRPCTGIGVSQMKRAKVSTASSWNLMHASAKTHRKTSSASCTHLTVTTIATARYSAHTSRIADSDTLPCTICSVVAVAICM